MQNRVQDATATLYQNFKFFRRNEAGNIAMMFGLSAVLVILGVGCAIDYARVVNAKSNLVAALDSASLFAAALNGVAEPEVKLRAQRYFDRNYTNTRDAQITAFDLKSYADHVAASGSVEVKTWFMNVGGIYDIEVNATSEVLKNGGGVEISLVLDVTGSMEGSKLSSLKSAANKFVDEILGSGPSFKSSRLALIPFSIGVNLAGGAAAARGHLAAGACATPGCETYNVNGNNFAATTCVTERLGPEKYSDASVGTNPVGFHYDSEANACNKIQPVVPLTNNKAQLHKTINALEANGMTAGQIGLAWGWYAISPSFSYFSGVNAPAPYASGNVSSNKIAVFMTDGEFNTAYCNGLDSELSCPATNGDPTQQARQLCAAMKAKGITIYTIGFQLETEKADDFMKDCATDDTTYFDADNEAELGVAFDAIAKSLLELRISK